MIDLTKRIDDPDGRVSKLIFEDETAIAETVVYRYADRGVVCFSVQSGCRMGCSFCGTGKKYIRDLEWNEMLTQVSKALKLIKDRPKIQIMAMSMGEPMDCWSNVGRFLKAYFLHYPSANIYLSTVGLRNGPAIADMLGFASKYKGFGLQFSLHHYDEIKRRILLGDSALLLSINELRHIANTFKVISGKRAYFNYIARGNETLEEALNIACIVCGHHLTCSVMCDLHGKRKASKDAVIKLMQKIESFRMDVELSVFDPEGQDTIGGGCGQLLYVQDRLANTKEPKQ